MNDYLSCYIRQYQWKCKACTKLILWSMGLTLNLAMENLFSDEILGRSPKFAIDIMKGVLFEAGVEWIMVLLSELFSLTIEVPEVHFWNSRVYQSLTESRKEVKTQRQEVPGFLREGCMGEMRCDTSQMTLYAYFQIYIVCNFVEMPPDVFVNLLSHILS